MDQTMQQRIQAFEIISRITMTRLSPGFMPDDPECEGYRELLALPIPRPRTFVEMEDGSLEIMDDPECDPELPRPRPLGRHNGTFVEMEDGSFLEVMDEEEFPVEIS